jgi:hypothetical protein
LGRPKWGCASWPAADAVCFASDPSALKCRRSRGLENSPTRYRYPPTKRSNAPGKSTGLASASRAARLPVCFSALCVAPQRKSYSDMAVFAPNERANLA